MFARCSLDQLAVCFESASRALVVGQIDRQAGTHIHTHARRYSERERERDRQMEHARWTDTDVDRHTVTRDNRQATTSYELSGRREDKGRGRERATEQHWIRGSQRRRLFIDRRRGDGGRVCAWERDV